MKIVYWSRVIVRVKPRIVSKFRIHFQGRNIRVVRPDVQDFGWHHHERVIGGDGRRTFVPEEGVEHEEELHLGRRRRQEEVAQSPDQVPIGNRWELIANLIKQI